MVNGSFNPAEGNLFFNYFNDEADDLAFYYKRDSSCKHIRLPCVPRNKAIE